MFTSFDLLLGSRRSIGIFIWTTNSEMDNRISGGPWLDHNNNTTFDGFNMTGLVDFD